LCPPGGLEVSAPWGKRFPQGYLRNKEGKLARCQWRGLPVYRSLAAPILQGKAMAAKVFNFVDREWVAAETCWISRDGKCRVYALPGVNQGKGNGCRYRVELDLRGRRLHRRFQTLRAAFEFYHCETRIKEKV